MATTENTWSDGDVATAALLNNLEDTVIVRCDSASRPTGAEGRVIFETDTNKLLIYDGSGWRLAGGFGWVSFTPSWSNLTVGSGTNTGEYCYAPGGMWVRGTFVYGSGSTMGSVPLLTLPNSESFRAATPGAIYGHAGIDDASPGNTYQIAIRYSSLTAVGFSAYRADATYSYFSSVTNTVPIAAGWATSDALQYLFFAPL